MTAFELMERMTVREINFWVQYDNLIGQEITKSDHQFALIMSQLDYVKGAKRSDPKKYLPKVVKKRRSRTLEEIKLNFNAAVAATGGTFPTVAGNQPRHFMSLK